MEQDRIERTSRRAVLQRGLRTSAGVAIVWLAGSRSHAESNKLDKAAVQYTDAGKVPGKDCDDCVQFVPGATAKDLGTCQLVGGDISPHGHCIAFTPKSKT